MSRTRRTPRNFGSYAAMEAGNVLLMPGLAFVFAWPRTWVEAIALVLASLATMLFLIVGTLYWRGLDQRLKGRGRSSLDRALAFADRVERPGIVLIVAAVVATGTAMAIGGWSWSILAAALLSLLAALEYVNYYKVQVQHFDNLADFRRLLSGKGGRRSHMARDLANWRR